MLPRKFLVVADDSAEFGAALRYACRRARSVGGRIVLLKVLEPAEFEHWSGVRDEIERQERAEAEASLQKLAEQVVALSGAPPEFDIRQAETLRAGIKSCVHDDAEIKILVLAAAVGGRGPGPLVASLAKEGVAWGGRKLPVTVVPGDLTDEEIEELA
jgi:nucleotide-binding universal stress UspA family protein